MAKEDKNKNEDVIIAFYFEDHMMNISSGIPAATLFRWRQNAKAFGASKFLMIDITTFQIGQYYQNSDSEIGFERYTHLNQIEDKYNDYEIVALETPNTLKQKGINYTYLNKFTHPKKAIYLVGADSGVADLSEGKKSKKWVVIPSVFENQIWSETAVTIALYDRFLKQIWQSK